MQPTPTSHHLPRILLPPALLLAILIAISLIAGDHAPTAFQTLAYALVPLILILAAASLGLAITSPFAKRACFAASPWPDAFRLIIAIALGLGALSLATLLLGSLHLLHPTWLPALLPLIAFLAGLPASRTFLKNCDASPLKRRAPFSESLLLLAAIPIAILLLAACYPPGSIWSSEGRAYDVLEYHLQLPREYSAGNSSAPLPHNIYSYLPANIEMLYLLLMQMMKLTLADTSHLWAVYPSQFLHALLTLLSVAAVALAPLRVSTISRILAALAMLTTPWLLVTGSLAYDEAGMMLFGSLALLLSLRTTRDRRRADGLLIGLLLGLAVGSKMTAGLFFAIPTAAILLTRRNFRTLIIATFTALLIYSPWAIRAALASHGNPLFPIATNLLGQGRGWTPELAARFIRGHGTLNANPFTALLHQSILDPQWSRFYLFWITLPIAITFALASRPKITNEIRRTEPDLVAVSVTPSGPWSLLLILALQLLAWMFLTHLQARFLLPILVPLALLIGLGAENIMSRILIAAALSAQAILIAFLLVPEVALPTGIGTPTESARQTTRELGELFSRNLNLAVFEKSPDSAQEIPQPKVLLIGTATPLFFDGDITYNTVFDRNPLGDILRLGHAPLAAKWLHEQGFNYVWIDWNEIARLRNTYGYDPDITLNAIAELTKTGIKPARIEAPAGITILKVNPVTK